MKYCECQHCERFRANMPEPRLLKECAEAMERQYSASEDSRRGRIKRGLTKQGNVQAPKTPTRSY
jgi:hypothetical protein